MNVQKIKAGIQLFRPELPMAAGMCVILGEILASGSIPPLSTLALGFICGFLLSASALIVNDCFDVEVDAVNAPSRPIPSGAISRSTAFALGVLTACIGLAATLAFHPVAFVLSQVIWILGFLYNWRLKSAGLLGNLIVCASVGSTFLIGGIAVGRFSSPLVWVFALIVFFFDLAEEIAGDAFDSEGDQERGSRSIAIVYGKPFALRLTGICFGVVALLSFSLITWGGSRYAVIMPMIDIVVGYFVVRLLRSQTEREGRWSMRMIYLSGSAGLLALLLGSLLP